MKCFRMLDSHKEKPFPKIEIPAMTLDGQLALTRNPKRSLGQGLGKRSNDGVDYVGRIGRAESHRNAPRGDALLTGTALFSARDTTGLRYQLGMAASAASVLRAPDVVLRGGLRSCGFRDHKSENKKNRHLNHRSYRSPRLHHGPPQ